MKTLPAVILAVALGLVATPVLAQSTPNGGSGAVAGEGPGGSGAGQSAAGPSKSFLRPKMHRRHKHRHG